MLGVLFSPRETFAAIVARPRWLGVMVVTLILTSAAYYMILGSQDMQDAIVDQQVRAIESRGNAVSDEQVANMERFIGYLPVGYAVGVFVLGPLFGAAVAGIITGIFTTLMGGNGTFKQVFAVMNHAGVIPALSAVFVAGMLAIGAKPVGVRPPGANLGVFLPMLEETSFLAVMLRSIDMFLLWWMIVLAIGLGVLYKRRTGPIATTFIGLYVVIALLIAVFTSGS
jgi:beta-lactamase regulating signal transducer with metallopeptidase domain